MTNRNAASRFQFIVLPANQVRATGPTLDETIDRTDPRLFDLKWKIVDTSRKKVFSKEQVLEMADK